MSSFNTALVTDMGYMFYGCSSLGQLDVSSLNTARVTDMNGMFGGCSVEFLDLVLLRHVEGVEWIVYVGLQ